MATLVKQDDPLLTVVDQTEVDRWVQPAKSAIRPWMVAPLTSGGKAKDFVIGEQLVMPVWAHHIVRQLCAYQGDPERKVVSRRELARRVPGAETVHYTIPAGSLGRILRHEDPTSKRVEMRRAKWFVANVLEGTPQQTEGQLCQLSFTLSWTYDRHDVRQPAVSVSRTPYRSNGHAKLAITPSGVVTVSY